jgi:hypothetical protein
MACQPPQTPHADDGSLHMMIDSTGLKVCGKGEWRVKQYGATKRRTWRKLHLALDETTKLIHTIELTTNAVTDASMNKPLLAGLSQPINKVGLPGPMTRSSYTMCWQGVRSCR